MLSSLLPRIEFLNFIGKNTLVLICTAGVFQTFVNSHMVRLLPYQDSLIGATVSSIILTALSIFLSVPVINLFNKYVPQLIGKPHHPKALLPDLSSLNFKPVKAKLNKVISVFGLIHED
jgi:hypothetical protein